jgi:hypothetical protein
VARAFGSSFKVPPPVEHDRPDAIRGAAALVEAKVKAINLRRRAEELREASRAQEELDDIAEKRRAFHGIWESSKILRNAPVKEATAPVGQGSAVSKGAVVGAKSGSLAVGAAAASTLPPIVDEDLRTSELRKSKVQTTDAFQSSLFTGKVVFSTLLDRCNDNPGASQLIDMAMRLDRTQEQEKKRELLKGIAEKRHLMIPERLGDDYTITLNARKLQSLSKDVARHCQSVVELMLTREELSTLQRMFPPDSPPSVTLNTIPDLLGALRFPGGAPPSAFVDVDALSNAFRNLLGIPTHKRAAAAKQKKGKPAERPESPDSLDRFDRQKLKDQDIRAKEERSAMDLNEALRALCAYLPFVQTRSATLMEIGNATLLKGDEGCAQEALALLAKANRLTDHFNLLRRNAESSRCNVQEQFVNIVEGL